MHNLITPGLWYPIDSQQGQLLLQGNTRQIPTFTIDPSWVHNPKVKPILRTVSVLLKVPLYTLLNFIHSLSVKRTIDSKEILAVGIDVFNVAKATGGIKTSAVFRVRLLDKTVKRETYLLGAYTTPDGINCERYFAMSDISRYLV